MSFAPRISVIIVSRHRQAALRRVLESLRFQTYKNFEVIVVSDVKDDAFFHNITHGKHVRHIHFDMPNISAARNIGIRHSDADVIAFCDDDAVPYPGWLERLAQPFQDPAIASVGGFVRARNGIEYQWKALLCDRFGDDHSLAIDETAPFTVVAPKDGLFAKLQGTNCAFRRDTLIAVAGFDEGFRFFLDETDLCLRLAQAGWSAAFVPDAQVHHGFAASEQRSDSRVPRTLFDIGKSKARFLAKHADQQYVSKSLETFVSGQRNRLITLMNEGRVEPRDVERLLDSLRKGLTAPVDVVPLADRFETESVFSKFPTTGKAQCIALGGSRLSRSKLWAKAAELSADGIPVLVFIFSINSIFHTRKFVEDGFWVQKGGLFGKSDREDPILQLQTLRSRATVEVEKSGRQYNVSDVQIVKMFRNFVSQKTKSSGKC